MYDAYLIKLLAYYDELKMAIGVIFGAIIQFIFSDNKNFGVLLTIGASSIFVAMYITTPIIDFYHLSADNEWVVALYAISSLISVPLLAVVISILPEAIKVKLKKQMGIIK